VKMTRLSCHRFRSNEVRLWLSVMAYNLGNLWRRLVLPRRIDNWSLTSLQQRLVKTGGRLVKHARYYWLLLAESHLTRRLFGSMVVAATPFENIARIPSVPPTPTPKLPSQEVLALRRMGRLDGDTFPPKVIKKPLRNPQVAPLNRRGITGCS
jgi:Transposase DDE domain group 1